MITLARSVFSYTLVHHQGSMSRSTCTYILFWESGILLSFSFKLFFNVSKMWKITLFVYPETYILFMSLIYLWESRCVINLVLLGLSQNVWFYPNPCFNPNRNQYTASQLNKCIIDNSMSNDRKTNWGQPASKE